MIGLWRNARALGVFLVAMLLATMPVGAADLGPGQGGALPGPLPLFPPDNWWNVDVSGAPVDGGSAAFIAYINNGGQRRLHPDLGGEVSPGSVQTYGMPYAVVDGTQPRDFVLDANQSDGLGVPFYPIPVEAITEAHWIEGGEPGNVDRRGPDRPLLIVDRDRNWFYELYNAASGRWEAGSGAFWDMNAHRLAPIPGRRAAQRDGRGGTAVSGLQRDDGARGGGCHGLNLGHLPRSDEARDARDQALTRSAPPRRRYPAVTSPSRAGSSRRAPSRRRSASAMSVPTPT